MFNRHILEKKSYAPTQYPNSFYSFYDTYTGEIIGDVQKLSFPEEIRRNSSINTAITKQLDIINEAPLYILKKDKDNKDKETDYKPALDFLNLLNNPNTYPAPRHWNDIVEGIYKTYIADGIAGIILVGGLTGEISNIEIAPYISYCNTGNEVYFDVSTLNTNNRSIRRFSKDKNEFFTNNDDIVVIFGNFSYHRQFYESPLTDKMDIILWQNHIIRSSRVFYENSCRPSGIVTVTINDVDGRPLNDVVSTEKVKKVIQDIKSQIKGVTNTGKLIVPSQPNLSITFTPLSITQNANDIEKQLEITKEVIYSSFSGLNTNVVEGISQYSENRLISLKEFYDSTIAIFNDVILQDLNTFLKNWLIFIGNTSDAIKRQGLYLTFDKNNIQYYKQLAKQEFITLGKQQILTRREVRANLSIDDSYADLAVLPPEMDGFIGEKTSNTL